jgi:hypothetical protein
MRTVQFIQFNHTSEFHSDYGYYPTHNEIYRLRDLDDSYSVEMEDDEGDTYEEDFDAISIFSDRRNHSGRSRRYVLKDNQLNFGILTIELDEESQLFR